MLSNDGNIQVWVNRDRKEEDEVLVRVAHRRYFGLVTYRYMLKGYEKEDGEGRLTTIMSSKRNAIEEAFQTPPNTIESNPPPEVVDKVERWTDMEVDEEMDVEPRRGVYNG